MTILPFERGPAETIGYLVSDEKNRASILIDAPLDILPDVERHIAETGFTLQRIVLTHGHWDHVGDTVKLAKRFGTPVLIHQADQVFLSDPMSISRYLPLDIPGCTADEYITQGNTVHCGEIAFDVLHVPGHTKGHIALYNAAEGILFAGDVLFAGSIGRTDLPGGDYDELMQSITERLLVLPPDTVVYPGHGPSTTIERERHSNPFILDYLDHFGESEEK